jgi:hypothetical protein
VKVTCGFIDVAVEGGDGVVEELDVAQEVLQHEAVMGGDAPGERLPGYTRGIVPRTRSDARARFRELLGERQAPMMDVTARVEFPDVEVLADNPLVLLCRVNGKLVNIAPRRMLPGTTVRQCGDRGTLVLTRKRATILGLV